MTIYLIGVIAAAATAVYVTATLTALLIARAHFPLPSNQLRLGCIDGLRGYVALSVLIHHFIFWMQVTRFSGTWEAPAVNAFNQLGAGGVALFFMTTGFVFYPRVLAGFRACSWPAIYTTRLFRIVPLIVVSVAIIVGIIAMRTGAGLNRDFPKAAAQWIAAWDEPPLLGYPDSGRLNAYVLWSLRQEWVFYLFVLPACALIMDLIRDSLPSWILPVIMLLISVFLRILYPLGPMLRYLPLFAIGMIAFECQRREWIVRSLRTTRSAKTAAAALGLGMVLAPTPYTFAMPLIGFFFICVACGNDMGGLLRTQGALVLGECSYGIYLLHGILLSLLFVDGSSLIDSIATNQLPFFLPLVAVTITLVTPVTHLLVERPAIRMGRYMSRHWTKQRLRTDAPELEVAP